MMNPATNPLVLTYHRIARRSGLWAGVLIAILVGGVSVAGLVSLQPQPGSFRVEAGQSAYMFILFVQAVILIGMGCNRVARAVHEEQNHGLLDSNRLTSLSASDLAIGYWLGPAAREFIMTGVLGIFALLLMLAGPLWVEYVLFTQILLFSSGLLLMLMTVVSAVAVRKAYTGGMVIVLVVVAIPPCLGMGEWAAPNYVLPYPLFFAAFDSASWWTQDAVVYNLRMPQLYLVLLTQAIMGGFFFFIAQRKLAEPDRGATPPWLAVTLFAFLAFLQHGLIWPVSRGMFPATPGTTPWIDFTPLGPSYLALLLVGLFLVAGSGDAPLRLRSSMLRAGRLNGAAALRRSMVPTACALAVIAFLSLTTHFQSSAMEQLEGLTVVAINVLCVFVSFAVIVEATRLLTPRHAFALILVALFVLYALPAVLSLLAQEVGPLAYSLLLPAMFYLADADSFDKYAGNLTIASFVHLLITAGLIIVWLVAWRRWLQRLARQGT